VAGFAPHAVVRACQRKAGRQVLRSSALSLRRCRLCSGVAHPAERGDEEQREHGMDGPRQGPDPAGVNGDMTSQPAHCSVPLLRPSSRGVRWPPAGRRTSRQSRVSWQRSHAGPNSPPWRSSARWQPTHVDGAGGNFPPGSAGNRWQLAQASVRCAPSSANDVRRA
jgi:hypothetical protein